MTATLKKIITFAILIGGLSLTGCGGANAVEDKPAENVPRLKITVGDKILFATLEDNATVKDFVSKLPTTLKMENLYGREMCYRYGAGGLAESATRADRYEIGDIVYWKPRGSFVILYKQNGEEFERVQLGHIQSGVEIFNGLGTTEIKFEIAE
ncbi:MAG: hypothetical protein IJT73_06390 [Selenomonadaceae bacterium]|nr:hypothetical protein [Selenomonadaceae bacterium]